METKRETHRSRSQTGILRVIAELKRRGTPWATSVAEVAEEILARMPSDVENLTQKTADGSPWTIEGRVFHRTEDFMRVFWTDVLLNRLTCKLADDLKADPELVGFTRLLYAKSAVGTVVQ